MQIIRKYNLLQKYCSLLQLFLPFCVVLCYSGEFHHTWRCTAESTRISSTCVLTASKTGLAIIVYIGSPKLNLEMGIIFLYSEKSPLQNSCEVTLVFPCAKKLQHVTTF